MNAPPINTLHDFLLQAALHGEFLLLLCGIAAQRHFSSDKAVVQRQVSIPFLFNSCEHLAKKWQHGQIETVETCVSC